jgi:hypothetical protein
MEREFEGAQRANRLLCERDLEKGERREIE